MTDAADQKRLLSFPLVPHGGERFPADIDVVPSATRYVGFYENEYGEQLVYVHEKGGKPTLYHGDYGWEPLPAEWPKVAALPLSSAWASGDLILNPGEVLWLASCLHASGATREEEGAAFNPLEYLARQVVRTGSPLHREHLDRQWSLRVAAIDQWRAKQQMAPSEEEDRYAEGAILVELGLNKKQRRPRPSVSEETCERIEREAADVVREIQLDGPSSEAQGTD